MAPKTLQVKDERAGAKVVYGAEECQKRTFELLEELGFPKGVLRVNDLVECGRVFETGFVWMKQKAPSQHYFIETEVLTSYDTEITCYIEKGKMRKITGVKCKLSKYLHLWISITEMKVDIPCSGMIHYMSAYGIGKSYPTITAMTEDEKQIYLENNKKM